jgi:hypothetical protein
MIQSAVTIFSKILEGIGLAFQHGREYQLSKLFDVGHAACRKHFLRPETFLPVGVLLSYSVFPCQVVLNASEHQQTISNSDVMLEYERSACQWTVRTPADLLSNWRQQEPSSQGDTDSCVTRIAGRVHWRGRSLDFFSVLQGVTVGCVLNSTPCIRAVHKIVFSYFRFLSLSRDTDMGNTVSLHPR